MKIKELLTGIDILRIEGNSEIEIATVTFDSRKCVKDSVFVAIKGVDSDGHNYIDKAISFGATAVVYEEPSYGQVLSESGVVGILVENSRKALALIAANYFGNPSEKIIIVGVTGTNGKTTIATLLYNLFRELGYNCGLLSTIANYVGNTMYPTTNTTSDPMCINALLSEMIERGCQYCFMEVSSHSLDQDRVTGLHFKGAIFTNLTHDHLDYHKTFAEYLKCKKRLFDNLEADSFALTNVDDKNGNIIVQNTLASIYRYSTGNVADFKAKIIEKSIEGSLLNIDGDEVWTRFIGAHNAHNLLAVYGTAILLGAKKDEVLVALSKLGSVSGRLEYIKGSRDVTAVVDYAHTPDALENVLKTLKEIDDPQIVTVFGCGGNRDKTKRPEMAKVAEKYSDKIVVTSDNPRFEDPTTIIEEIKAGFEPKGRAKTLYIVDRKEAIRTALSLASDGAIVLIAGKGHEDYQIINGVKRHFDDKEVVKEFFEDNK